MPLYLTGLITTDYSRFPPFPYVARGWKLHLVATERSLLSAEFTQDRRGRAVRRNGKEVAIEARDDAAAKRIAFMLDASAQCLDGSAFLSWFGGRIELKKIAKRLGRQRADVDVEEPRATRSYANIPLECQLAIKTIRRRARIYALTKLWLSYQVFSVDSIDLDPSHSATIRKSGSPVDHVSYATAIVLAYSVIEELGLEIRASPQRPSTINGEWNLVVKDEPKARLQAAGIDIAETYHWQIRGSKTKLEQERHARKIKRSPWARWKVRDVEVALVDAIAHVSWLRSRVSAHRTKYEFVRVLSVYDVANAQYLARRLFLESVGFWRLDSTSPDFATIKETRSGR
jgi:hypothetical protein